MGKSEEIYFPLNLKGQKARKLYTISKFQRCTVIQLIKDIIEEYLANTIIRGVSNDNRFSKNGQIFTRRIVGERIAMFRSLSGLTQEELGLAIGLDQSSVSKIELGIRRLDVIEAIAIAHALDISLSEIIGAY